jgi:hypothetical protein
MDWGILFWGGDAASADCCADWVFLLRGWGEGILKIVTTKTIRGQRRILCGGRGGC